MLYYTQYRAQDVPMIFAVDLNTMEAFPLCGKPDCEHQDKRCGAYAGGFGDTVQLTAYRGQIYFQDRVLPASILYRVNTDGSGRTEVTRLNWQLEHGGDGFSRSRTMTGICCMKAGIIRRTTKRSSPAGRCIENP